jgi:hypothetical protein
MKSGDGKMMRIIGFVVMSLLLGVVRAELPGVLHWQVEQDLDTVYHNVYNALEENKYFVIFEANIGANLARFSEQWGEAYNRSQLRGIRSMVICNPWYTNEVSNQDPDMLVLCPLHLSLYQKDGITHVGFTRPTHVGEGSDAMPLLKEIETVLSNAVEQAIARLKNNSQTLPPQGDKRYIGNQGQPDEHQHQEGDSRPEQ